MFEDDITFRNIASGVIYLFFIWQAARESNPATVGLESTVSAQLATH